MAGHKFILAIALLVAGPIYAQAPVSDSPPDERGESEPDVVRELTEEESVQVQEWIEQLGSDHFAARERAAIRLTEIGAPVLADLRRVARESDDPEVRVRADDIVRQLTQGDLKSRVEDFLAGEDVNFEGWRVARAILGDSNAVRELFIELMKAHPELTASLDGTMRDRAVAADGVVTKVQHATFIQRKHPTRADAFALLLPPAVDMQVPINAAHESVLLGVLHKEAASKIRGDAQLAGAFKVLLNRWVVRSTLSSREDVLLFGMRWELEATLPLARQTLVETKQTETLAFAFQAIARFGDRTDVEFVRPFLNDTRPSSESGFAGDKMIRTELGDVAMATIAMLYKVPLSEAGFADTEPDRTFGFTLSEIGFPFDNEAPRKAARAKIDKLLEKAPEPEGS